MKITSKPAVFAGERVAVDLSLLTLRAVILGVAVALLAALAVVGIAAWTP